MDFYRIQQGKDLPHNIRLLNLNPFLESNNLLRVGERLNASQFAFNKKYPIILPGNHHFISCYLNMNIFIYYTQAHSSYYTRFVKDFG